MSVLRLIRVPIRKRELVRWAGERGWTRHGKALSQFDEGRALHHLLTEVFGPRALQPFRLLIPARRNNGNLYAYSVKDTVVLKEAVRAFAWPEHLAILQPDRIEGKRMPQSWSVGQQLGFDLLCRPVRRMRRPATTRGGFAVGKKVGTELDAFWLKCLREPGKEHRREDVYLDWLAEQIGKAAELDRSSSRMKRFQRVRVSRGSGSTEGPYAVIHGLLTVSDSTAFSRLLARGVGRHRAFGYGMLLLRPPRNPAFGR